MQMVAPARCSSSISSMIVAPFAAALGHAAVTGAGQFHGAVAVERRNGRSAAGEDRGAARLDRHHTQILVGVLAQILAHARDRPPRADARHGRAHAE